MSEWKDARNERPETNCCCVIIPKYRAHHLFAIYNKNYDIFELDAPESSYALFPVDVAYYLEIPEPPSAEG